jgi:hypothetical protein
MFTKAFGIYTSGGDDSIKNDALIIEVGYSHIACLVKGSDNMITAFELYTRSKQETSDFKSLFSGVLANSQLLDKTYADTNLYINNQLAIAVPAARCDTEIVNDYLNIVFAEDEGTVQQVDDVSAEAGLINAFRIQQEWLDVVNRHFKMVKIQHSYTSIIRSVITTASDALIKVQFYPAYIITVVMKDGALQFIQSFMYQSTEDVLYYLLSISQQFNLNTPDLTIYASGMIDLRSAMHSQLVKYFKDIVLEDADKSRLAIDMGQHPSHYFTPFFNLAQ